MSLALENSTTLKGETGEFEVMLSPCKIFSNHCASPFVLLCHVSIGEGHLANLTHHILQVLKQYYTTNE